MSVRAIRRLFIYVRRDAIFDSNHVTQHARHLFRRWVGRLFLTRNFWTVAPWQKLYCREAYGRTFLHACIRHRRQLVRLTLDYGTDFLGMLARIEYAQGAIHGVEVVANLFVALLRSYEVAESSARLARNALMT